jgi:hypothetical protein
MATTVFLVKLHDLHPSAVRSARPPPQDGDIRYAMTRTLDRQSIEDGVDVHRDLITAQPTRERREFTRLWKLEMRLQSLPGLPPLNEQQPVRVLNMPRNLMGPTSRFGSRSADVNEARRQQLVDVGRTTDRAAEYDDHRDLLRPGRPACPVPGRHYR